MDTPTVGHSFLPAPGAKKARKAKQSLPLFHWLAHCDDVTGRDIIIILVNAVTQSEELLRLTVENLRMPHVVGAGGKTTNKGGAIANLESVRRSRAHDGSRQVLDSGLPVIPRISNCI